MTYTTRPLSSHDWLRPGMRVNSQFSAPWSETLALLDRELDHLSATDVYLGVDVPEGDLRLDGQIRANARPASPGVEIAFASKHGPMLYRCDRYMKGVESWKHNIRAIALTLESLRAVERYGASNSGEQYRGYRQIGASAAVAPEDALNTLRRLAGLPLDSDETQARVLSLARRNAHPDHGGTGDTWAMYTAAANLAGSKS